MASLLLSVPCASWITVHAFGAHSSRRANSLGRGCLYSPHQLESLKQHQGQQQGPFTTTHPTNEVQCAHTRQALAALSQAIQSAQEAVRLPELQLRSNIFPHAYAAALSAAGLFDSNAAPWVASAPLLHVEGAVRVYNIESLVEHMRQLLLPLQRLLQPRKHSEDELGEEDKRAAGLRALGLLIGVAEDVIVRTLMRERIHLNPAKLVLCSQVAFQAEPQWPLTLEAAQCPHRLLQRQRLSSLLQQFERLRDGQWSDSPALHAAYDEVPEAKSVWPGQSHTNKEQFQALEETSLPSSYVDGRLLFHQLRVQNKPWLQVVGPSGSLGEWGAGARVKDAAILAHQVAERFASFPDIKPEQHVDFMARLNGGWLEHSTLL